MLWAAAGLVILTSSDGLPVHVNSEQIVSMRSVRPSQKDHVAKGVRCLLDTVDGKFVSVTETCDEVRGKIGAR